MMSSFHIEHALEIPHRIGSFHIMCTFHTANDFKKVDCSFVAKFLVMMHCLIVCGKSTYSPGRLHSSQFFLLFFPVIFSELIFMRAGGKGASPGNHSLVFLFVTAVALVLFRSQDVALPFDKSKLIEKL